MHCTASAVHAPTKTRVLYIYIYTYTLVYLHTYILVCANLYISLYIYLHMHIYIYISTDWPCRFRGGSLRTRWRPELRGSRAAGVGWLPGPLVEVTIIQKPYSFGYIHSYFWGISIHTFLGISIHTFWVYLHIFWVYLHIFLVYAYLHSRLIVCECRCIGM